MRAAELITHARVGLPGVLLGLPALVAVEAAITLFGRTRPPASEAPGLFALAAAGALAVLWLPAVISVLVDALAALSRDASKSARRMLFAVIAVLFAGFTADWYLVLVEYEPFRGYLPLVGLAVASWLAFTAHAGLTMLALGRRWIAPAAHVTTLAVCGAACVANYTIYAGLYPTLHHAVVLLTAMCMFRGLSGLVTFAPPSFRKWGALAGLLITTVLAVAGAAGIGDEAKPYFFNSSELGRIVSMSEDATVFAGSGDALKPASDVEHLARFEQANGLPTLPPSFKLEDYNVLIIASEATRFDKTSLHPEGPATTPNIARAASKAWVAERAYSPSSGTLHSMSSLFTMKFPSAIDMSTWMQPWYGELQPAEVTAAELFAEHGYETFWIGHDHNLGFSRSILGLEQGFQTVDRITEYSKNHRPTTDGHIAKRAKRKLQQLAKSPDERFFGLIFFVSPHGPYLSHGFDDLPSKSALDKYLQEIRNVDEQFEIVFESLEQTKLLDNTIVILLSDHGEEFREHGGVRHKSTVYTESIHVPLVVWLPGMKPARSSAPVSTIYVLPWLLSRAETPALRAAAHKSITEVIGPVLAATDGAVVSELVGHDRIRSALTYEQYKLNYDYRSKLFELYDVRVDPLEQQDLFATSDQKHWRQVFARYDAVRQQTLKHKFLPKKKAPSINQYRKKLREDRKKEKEAKKSSPAKSP